MDLVCVVSPSLLYVEMRSANHLCILSVSRKFLVEIHRSSVDVNKKTPQMKSIYDKILDPSQMDFICDKISRNKDRKSSQARPAGHLWILSVRTISKGFSYGILKSCKILSDLKDRVNLYFIKYWNKMTREDKGPLPFLASL